MADILEIRDVSLRFGGVRALTNVSLGVRAGELFSIIGPNGAGKTTLLECAAGVRHADAGTVALGDAPLAPHERKRVLFYLADGVRPWPDQPVAWMLEFVEALFGAERGVRGELVGALGLGALLGKRAGARVHWVSAHGTTRARRAGLLPAVARAHPRIILARPASSARGGAEGRYQGKRRPRMTLKMFLSPVPDMRNPNPALNSHSGSRKRSRTRSICPVLPRTYIGVR